MSALPQSAPQTSAANSAATALSAREVCIATYAVQLRDALCSVNALSAQMVGALDRWSAADLGALAPAFDLAVRQAGEAATCLAEVGSSEGVA